MWVGAIAQRCVRGAQFLLHCAYECMYIQECTCRFRIHDHQKCNRLPLLKLFATGHNISICYAQLGIMGITSRSLLCPLGHNKSMCYAQQMPTNKCPIGHNKSTNQWGGPQGHSWGRPILSIIMEFVHLGGIIPPFCYVGACQAPPQDCINPWVPSSLGSFLASSNLSLQSPLGYVCSWGWS